MTYLVLDAETTTFQKGNPFSIRNKLVVVGIKELDNDYYYLGLDKDEISNKIKNTTLVTFNGKFDLHWLRRHGIDISSISIWDCQLAHFILRGQSCPYPSLNSVAEWYNLGSKLDVVLEEYWKQGIDTDAIPRDVLEEYLRQDLLLTEQVFQEQLKEFKEDPLLYKLFKLHCLDLLVLEDMEWNGMLYDVEESERLAVKEEEKIRQIEQELLKGFEDVPINFQSRDHLSSYLYGGTITVEDRLPIGVFKTGAKIGQQRFKKVSYTFNLPGFVKPPKGSELAKEGYYATDEGTLRSIRCDAKSRKRLDLLLERSKSSKLIGTYYRGIPDLITEMDWPSGTIHGSFNQCVAATGRLSSSRPNLQNFAGAIDTLLGSRYGPSN